MCVCKIYTRRRWKVKQKLTYFYFRATCKAVSIFLACPVSRRGLRNQLRALLGLDVSPPPFVLE